MKPEQIKEIEEARSKITPGKWCWSHEYEQICARRNGPPINDPCVVDPVNVLRLEDRDFIVSASSYIDELLAERKELLNLLREVQHRAPCWTTLYGEQVHSDICKRIDEILGGEVMEEVKLPELDIAYECERDYGLTQPTGGDYSIIESNARARCRERQLLEAQRTIAELRENLDDSNRKGEKLCSTLGNLLIHIHDLGLRKDKSTIYGDFGYKNERAELAEDRLKQSQDAVKSLYDLLAVYLDVDEYQGIRALPAVIEALKEDFMDGIGLIAQERKRQVEVEGWTPDHDSLHSSGELLAAASCYAKYAEYQSMYAGTEIPRFKRGPYMEWPWDKSWWKPSDNPIRNIEKSGALMAAEIDRLQRLNQG